MELAADHRGAALTPGARERRERKKKEEKS